MFTDRQKKFALVGLVLAATCTAALHLTDLGWGDTFQVAEVLAGLIVFL